MIPFFINAGAANAVTVSPLGLVAPTTSVGNSLVAVIATNDNTTPTGFDARWVLIANTTSTVAIETSVYLLPDLKSGDSGATFNFTVAGTTVAFGQLFQYGGTATQAGPLNKSASANASSATVTWTTITQREPNSIILLAYGYGLNGVTDGGVAGGATFTNRATSTTALGNTEALGLYDASINSGAALGTLTMATGASAAVNVGVAFELYGLTGSDLASGGGLGGVGRATYPALQRVLPSSPSAGRTRDYKQY